MNQQRLDGAESACALIEKQQSAVREGLELFPGV